MTPASERTPYRRLFRLQNQIHKAVRADVRRAIGSQSPELTAYYNAYKREFRGPSRLITKETLLSACSKSDIVLLGDYHTFSQSQKAALRLLRELISGNRKLALSLELVRATDQPILNAFMRDEITEKEFLEKIEYSKSWGFRWENFRPLFEFAKANHLEVLGLNVESEKLEVRDATAAEVLCSWSARNPDAQILALYGDLHLARGHIPRHIKSQLKARGLKRKTITIFQNSETLYWKLAQDGTVHTANVIALGRDRYCIMNAAPWVKLQSYLEWAESAETTSSTESLGLDLHELARERLRNLIQALDLKISEDLDFTVQTSNDLSFLSRNSTALAGLTREQAKVVKYKILGNRTIYIPSSKTLYLASQSVNAMADGVTQIVHSELSGASLLFYDPSAHFYSAAISATLTYFGSKILNHNRRCDLEEDLKALLSRNTGSKTLPQEKLQRRAARHVLCHCSASRRFLQTEKYRAPISLKENRQGLGRIPLLLETARGLGGIFGEKLYSSFIEGKYTQGKIVELFHAKLEDSKISRKTYLELITDLAHAPLAHSSKLDLL